MAKISEYGGKIIFDRVVSNIFDYNLKMIDIGLSSALGEALLSSYKHNEKNLNKLFTESTIYNNKTLALKKLEDFLMAASFGMFPGSVWAGNYEANGGLIVVEENSEVYVIDMVYFSDEIKKFLVAESRLDTPSSSRYNMPELIEENDKVYFTLNLQVRYY